MVAVESPESEVLFVAELQATTENQAAAQQVKNFNFIVDIILVLKIDIDIDLNKIDAVRFYNQLILSGKNIIFNRKLKKIGVMFAYKMRANLKNMNTTCTYLNDEAVTEYRVILFAQSPDNKELKQQMDIFEADSAGLRERNVQIQIIFNNRQSKGAYLKYNVPFNQFSLVFFGKNQSAGFRSDQILTLNQLYKLLN